MERSPIGRWRQVLTLTGLGISAAFGAWHFFIPVMFRWYSYIPDAPRNLVVSVDWTNFFFSLLLFGVSLLLLMPLPKLLRSRGR